MEGFKEYSKRVEGTLLILQATLEKNPELEEMIKMGPMLDFMLNTTDFSERLSGLTTMMTFICAVHEGILAKLLSEVLNNGQFIRGSVEALQEIRERKDVN